MIRLQTNKGEITIELNYDKAPETCKNFEQYVQDGFFDNTIFHRVISGFMVQGGGFEAGMKQKEGRAPIKNEAENKLKNDAGTLAMARTPDPHSASSQFFINVADNSFLNHTAPTDNGWGYCVFAKVTSGLDVVMDIASVKTTASGMHQDVPVEDVVIEKAEVTGTA